MRKQKGSKSARLLALDALERAGDLEGLTARRLGELLDVDPATAHRSRHELPTVRNQAQSLIEHVRRLLAGCPDE